MSCRWAPRARELIYDYGGGVLDGRPLKGLQAGRRIIGAAGSGAPGRAAGTGVHGPRWARSWAPAGVVVYDDTVCMVDAAYRDGTLL